MQVGWLAIQKLGEFRDCEFRVKGPDYEPSLINPNTQRIPEGCTPK